MTKGKEKKASRADGVFVSAIKGLATWTKDNKSSLLHFGICLILATLFVLVRSYSTSFLFADYYSFGGPADGGDSLQFLTMGKLWLEGKIPYIEFFDHKGPFAFFFDMLGFLIGGGTRYGVVILQILFLAISFFYILKICSLVTKKSLWGWMVLAISMVYMSASFASGNSVQEWNLPFLAVAIYYMVRYFYQEKKDQTSHNPWHALIYGVAIGACFLAQISHAIILCAGILVIFCLLVARKNWKNLDQNLLFGLGGFLGIMLPFVIYFIATGALLEFFYYTLIYNLFYVNGVGSWLKNASSEAISSFILIYLPFFCAFFTAILAWIRKRRSYAVLLFLTGCIEAYLFFSTQAFSQYALPLIFQLVLFLNEVYLISSDNEASRLLKIGIVSLLMVCTYDLGSRQIINIYNVRNMVRASGENGIGYENLLESHLDEIRDSTFTAYADNALKAVYLRYDLTPNNRFFVIQSWHAAMNDDLAKEIHQDFLDNKAEYILVDEVSSVREGNINDILGKYYTKIGEDGEYRLYKLKE